jgi:hypothetical protein
MKILLKKKGEKWSFSDIQKLKRCTTSNAAHRKCFKMTLWQKANNSANGVWVCTE